MKLNLLFLFLVMSCASSQTLLPSSAPKRSLTEQYNQFMLTHPTDEVIESCQSINFRSDRRLRRHQRNLFLNNPQMAIPNYNGKYLLLENPIREGSEWFVVNCKTGKLETVFPIIGDILFRPESRLIVTKTFGDFETLSTYQESADGLPQIYEWKDRQWIKIENPLQK